MKKTLLLLTLLWVAAASFGQDTTAAVPSGEFYLQKSKDQKRAAWILLGGGTALAVAGAIQIGNTSFWSNDNSGYVLFSVGTVAGLISVPLFISSARNARRAATFSFHQQPLLVPQHSTLILQRQPTLTLSVGL